jgi:hypothetical protein
MPLFQAAGFCIHLGENIGLLVVSDSNLKHADYLEVLILVHFAYNEVLMCRKKCRSNLRITAQ